MAQTLKVLVESRRRPVRVADGVRVTWPLVDGERLVRAQK